MALLALGAIGFIGLLVAAVAGIMVYQSYADDLVAPDELAINQPSYGAKIFDRNGNFLYEYVDDKSGLRRPVKLEDVSEAFLAATIATEDSSFFTNPGVNIRGLLRAAWENSPLGGSGSFFEGSGGSSITQQLVKNVYISPKARQERWSSEGIDRKLRETIYAMELTQNYSKERILEWYVNQISYGGLYNGVEAASQGYFGKSARDLTLAEAALLAGIPQSPLEYDPVNELEGALQRRNEILDLLQRKGRVQIGEGKYFEVNAEIIAASREEPIVIAEKRFPIEAPHFVLQYVQPQLEALFGKEALYTQGLVVTTSLDLNLQHRAAEIMEKHIRDFENISNSRDGALMVMTPGTGEILVMLGSRDYWREDIRGKNNNATACNSPGSSFKPFSYMSAFMNLGWGPGTIVLDTAVSYPQDNGRPFTPVNPARNFQGPITIRNALGNSLNVPAVKVAVANGPERVATDARKLGFMTSFRTEAQEGCTNGYGAAIATGGIGVTLEEMMFGYSVLANGGVMKGQAPVLQQQRGPTDRRIDPVAVLKVTDGQGQVRYDLERAKREQRVVPEEYPYLIFDILSDSQARCITFACGISVPGYRVAVKTGTSEPFDPEGPNAGKIGETWAFGYTPDLVVGIWAGNTAGEPIVNIFSTSISFRTMSDVMVAAYAGRPQTPYPRPAGVVEETVCVPSGLKPTPLCGRTTKDLFAKDKVPTQEDNWWQRVRIDTRNEKLAALFTPPQFVQERVMLVPPPEAMRTEDDKKVMQEWAQALNLPLAPTEVSDLPAGAIGVPGSTGPGPAGSPFASVVIITPLSNGNVTGIVPVIGRARSENFVSFRVEFGQGPAPATWMLLAQGGAPVELGTLASWNVLNLPSGVYTLRLTVVDAIRGQLTSSVTVNVN
jgi:membrane peptidoglycan carboxypeptidase